MNVEAEHAIALNKWHTNPNDRGGASVTTSQLSNWLKGSGQLDGIGGRGA